MEVLLGIFGMLLLLFLYLYIKECRQKKEMQQTYKEQDVMLTHYIAENLDMEKRLSDMQYEYEKQKEMAEEVQRVQGQIRALKHDMKNHTLVILSYLQEEKHQEAKQYAGEILDKLNKMYTYVNVGNSLLNYILNNKLSKAKEQGCEMKAEIENLEFAYMDSLDFSVLLNNVLDNAVEGALSSKDKKLEVQISAQKGFDIITVKNSIDVSVLETNPQLISTKQEARFTTEVKEVKAESVSIQAESMRIKKEVEHGFGMKQIKAIVDKYNGHLDIYEKKNMFIVNIMLDEQ